MLVRNPHPGRWIIVSNCEQEIHKALDSTVTVTFLENCTCWEENRKHVHSVSLFSQKSEQMRKKYSRARLIPSPGRIPHVKVEVRGGSREEVRWSAEPFHQDFKTCLKDTEGFLVPQLSLLLKEQDSGFALKPEMELRIKPQNTAENWRVLEKLVFNYQSEIMIWLILSL